MSRNISNEIIRIIDCMFENPQMYAKTYGEFESIYLMLEGLYDYGRGIDIIVNEKFNKYCQGLYPNIPSSIVNLSDNVKSWEELVEKLENFQELLVDLSEKKEK